jgi:hypothetical protein
VETLFRSFLLAVPVFLNFFAIPLAITSTFLLFVFKTVCGRFELLSRRECYEV